ncbi:MAG: cyclic-di-AMP receptor [Anaerolineae bacterium]|nr:cyclic-di-AMP receptor [Anaerolineae bacterium]
MKLIITIIDDQDVDKVMSTLTSQRIGVTRVSSTGGLLGPGSSTLMIGVDESQVPQAMQIVGELAAQRQAVVPYGYSASLPLASLVEIPVGGFSSFVLDIDHFEQV